ncbi:peptidoglycan/LPS O-acetylase OafA/YrhL [Paraburkholderia caballeronis]|uniref:acyltransferase family protein n=1 Tax=Paraburkholderia caballeronis TaxID=416943 RepID=UPI0010660BBC|nr:acyltransferase [Paraburkholderia caballeronis]TDV36242.1 peptidoglycan/LPS O-acetylase OafA/YrhL [Paraburkholderia caballeronis]
MAKLRSLNVLRAVAATTVIVHHVLATTRGAAFGEFRVDIFFVLSGFVIALTLNSRRQTVREFVVGRFTRIVPLYWLMTLLVFALALLRPDVFNSTTANLDSLLRSLFFIPYRKENGLIHPLLFVGWTLDYEVLFYLIAAAALLLMPKRTLAFIAVALATIFLIAEHAPSRSAIVEFLSYGRMLEFPLGAAAWLLWKRGLRLPLAVAGVGVVAMYGFMTYTEWLFPLSPPLLSNGLPSVILILCTLSLEALLTDNWLCRLVVLLGDASYATYLSHPFIVEAMRKLVPKVVHGFDVTSPPGIALAVVCASAVGYALHRYVDTPLHGTARRIGNRLFVVPNRSRVTANALPEQIAEKS